MVTCLRDLVLSKASRKGRECAHRARLLLFFLLFFSSLSFGSVSGSLMYSSSTNSNICVSSMSACSHVCSVNGAGTASSATSTSCTCDDTANQGGYPVYSMSSCTASCSVPAGTVDTASNSPSSGGSFCASNSDCEETVFASFAQGQEVFATNGSACLPSATTSSTPNNCPSGYSPSDSTGCSCSNSSGDFVPSNNSDTNPSCNGGSSTAPTLSPVSPVTSGGTTSCPSGDASISSGSSTSCYVVVIPPAVNQSVLIGLAPKPARCSGS